MAMSPLQFLSAWRDGGHLRGIRGVASNVLMVYVSRADWKTGEAFPSVDRIAKADWKTGEAFPSVDRIAKDVGEKNKYRVRRAIEKLVGRGLLELVRPGGGKGKTAIMRLTCPRSVDAHRYPRPAQCKTGSKDVPLTLPHAIGEGGQSSPAYRDGFVAHTGTDSVPPSIQNDLERSRTTAPNILETSSVEDLQQLKLQALSRLDPWQQKSLEQKSFRTSPVLKALMLEALRLNQAPPSLGDAL